VLADVRLLVAYSAPLSAPLGLLLVAYSAPLSAPLGLLLVAYSAPLSAPLGLQPVAYSAPLSSLQCPSQCPSRPRASGLQPTVGEYIRVCRRDREERGDSIRSGRESV
jgi:hypothetical protein